MNRRALCLNNKGLGIMPFFNRDGQKLWYVDTGNTTGPTVVFSHGFLMDGSMFATNIEALRRDFRCIVWDQRGFGHAKAPGRRSRKAGGSAGAAIWAKARG